MALWGKLGFEPTKFGVIHIFFRYQTHMLTRADPCQDADWRLTKQAMFTLLRQCAAVVFCWVVIPYGWWKYMGVAKGKPRNVSPNPNLLGCLRWFFNVPNGKSTTRAIKNGICIVCLFPEANPSHVVVPMFFPQVFGLHWSSRCEQLHEARAGAGGVEKGWWIQNGRL